MVAVCRPRIAPRARAACRLGEPSSAAARASPPHHLLASALAASLALSGMVAPAAFAEVAPVQAVQGFEEFAAQGGKMKADPSCFFNECAPARAPAAAGEG